MANEMIQRDIYVLSKDLVAPIQYVQSSNAIEFRFNIRDYGLPTNAEARVCVRRPSRSVEYISATIYQNSVMFTPTTSMFCEHGKNDLQIKIMSNTAILVSFIVPVFVEQNITDTNTPGKNTTNLFDEAIKETLESPGVSDDIINAATEVVTENVLANLGDIGGGITFTEITANSSINDYLEDGWYRSSTSEISKSLNDISIVDPFVMQVMNAGTFVYRVVAASVPNEDPYMLVSTYNSTTEPKMSWWTCLSEPESTISSDGNLIYKSRYGHRRYVDIKKRLVISKDKLKLYNADGLLESEVSLSGYTGIVQQGNEYYQNVLTNAVFNDDYIIPET